MTFNELARKRYSCRKLSANTVGYADPSATPSPMHAKRKSSAELVKSL